MSYVNNTCTYTTCAPPLVLSFPCEVLTPCTQLSTRVKPYLSKQLVAGRRLVVGLQFFVGRVRVQGGAMFMCVSAPTSSKVSARGGVGRRSPPTSE